MFLLTHTCRTTAEDLALDEVLLDYVERTAAATGDDVPPPGVLRLWEAQETAVVLGRSSSLAGEADLEQCRQRGVPILRRTSGGAAVVVGPGCLMYSVVLAYRNYGQLRAVDEAHRFVLGKVAEALRPLVPGIALRGTSDLAWGERKFSGNSLRCRREALLYHGTLLYGFPLDSIGALLRTPPRQPDYRAGRSHGEFVGNLPTTAPALAAALAESFAAGEPLPAALRELLLGEARQATTEKYLDPEWTSRVP